METNLIHGDCLVELARLPDASVDSVVTDPPYELGFMGKTWDKSGIAYNVEVWKEALRVLRPGGHLLAFGGSRTYHRLASAIEDAGFEIRDQIMWVYGSGFPKSLDVSKAIDRAAGAARECTREGVVKRDGYGDDWDTGSSSSRPRFDSPATDAAKQWDGWGTALKPAHEPIVVARKPLIGTVSQNVLEHGTGAMNIDGCRIEAIGYSTGGQNRSIAFGSDLDKQTRCDGSKGRWPANLIHDGSEEVLEEFAKAGESTSRKGKPRTSAKPGEGWGMTATGAEYDDSGSPSRFFYCAKANKKDRGEGNNHPTVKPTDLMRYLVRLITPSQGTVLDPFCGSGSTGKAALLEGFKFVGIERDEAYIEIAKRRVERNELSG